MLEDRSEFNKNLALENYYPPFFSILIPEFGRPQYAIKCVDSIHAWADMPIEIILHDDGSGMEKERELFEKLYHRTSTLIFNCGRNFGLARSMNRCRMASSSKYLLQFNADTYMRSSFLKNMKAALDFPYIGTVIVSPGSIGEEGPWVHVTKDKVKIRLVPHAFSTTLHLGFRRDVYDEVGGWDENVQTTASDVGFVGNIFGRGYFAAVVEGKVYNEMLLPSGETNPDYINSARFSQGDNSAPTLFKMERWQYVDGRARREEDIWRSTNIQRNANQLYPSWYNHNFINSESKKLFPDGKIDWEFAKVYGHDKWKDRIIKDFHLE